MNSSTYKEYSKIAYKRAVIASLQRYLMEFISTDAAGAIRTLDCEEVLASDRTVPEEAFHDVLDQLREEEERIKLELSAFEVRRRPPALPIKQEGSSSTSEDGEDSGKEGSQSNG